MFEKPQPVAAWNVAGSLPDAAHVTGGKRRYQRRLAASPSTLFTVRHLDGRSLAFRRARAIAAELAAGFGAEITRVQQQAVERAAVLCAIAEDLSVRRLGGQPVPIDEVLRAEGVARRAVRAIVAERPAKPRGLQRARARWEADEQARAAQAARRRKAPAQTPTKALDDDQAETD
jgi:hypothetical protein